MAGLMALGLFLGIGLALMAGFRLEPRPDADPGHCLGVVADHQLAMVLAAVPFALPRDDISNLKPLHLLWRKTYVYWNL